METATPLFDNSIPIFLGGHKVAVGLNWAAMNTVGRYSRNRI